MKNRKGLVFGVIVLFLGMSIVPIVGSIPIEKNVSVTNLTQINNMEIKTGLRGLNITFKGTMGENGWYVSCVEIIIVFENDTFAKHLFYEIDSGIWTEYTPPVDDIVVCENGTHYFFGYTTDDQGNIMGVYGPFSFKIDQTPPSITAVTGTPENLLRTKWLLSTIVSDSMSGVARVAFLVDDIFVGNVTSPPWEFHYQGHGSVLQAIAYDYAGNWALSPSITMPLVSPQSQSQSSPSVQQNSQNLQINQLLQNLILLPHQMIKR